MTDSQQLLANYVNGGSEAAFRDLVARYTDLVYSTALRLVDGDTLLAQDVAQTVFIDLARMARKLSPDVLLGGWLHRHTRFVAATLMRSERRRKLRERQVVEMDALQNQPGSDLRQVSAMIDEAIDALAKEDREAVLLRFFEQSDLRSVGAALGVTENAARMRVSRALEKLQVLLKRRGATLSVTALAAALGAEAVVAAPAGLAATLAVGALSANVAGTGLTLTLIKGLAMTKMKLALLTGALVAGVSIPIARQHQHLTQLRQENTNLRQQLSDLGRLADENARLSNLVAQGIQPSQQEPSRELLKLRAEAAQLKRQLAERPKERQAVTGTATPAYDPLEVQKVMGIAKMNYTKGWMLAFLNYATQNQGQFPTNFDTALSFLPDETRNQTNFATDQFEILYQGSVDAITNPASIIVLREKEPWQTPDGGWVRDYAFADGHCEIHKAETGDFQPWEAMHLVPTPPTGQNQP